MKTLLSLLLLALAAAVQAAPAPLSIDPKGIAINAGPAGRFILQNPVLVLPDGQELKPKWTALPEGGGGTLRYEGAPDIAVTVANGAVTYKHTLGPGEAKLLKFVTIIPLSFNQGGKYIIDDMPPVDIPQDKNSQFLQHGESERFGLVSPSGAGLVFEVPVSWQGLQDNRTWNWDVYAWMYNYDFAKAADSRELTISIETLPASAAKP